MPRLIRPLIVVLLLLPLAIYAVQQGGREGRQDDAPAEVGVVEIGQALGEREQLYRQALERLEQRLARYPEDYEAQLLTALIKFKSGDLEAALNELQGLTRRQPNFHLAHLIHGDLLLARARVVRDIGTAAVLDGATEGRQEIALLREEAEARLRAYLDTLPRGRLPRALLMLDEGIDTALVVDKGGNRLYVYERGPMGEPELLHDFYVSTGKLRGNKRISGDLRTPEGVYFITRHIPGDKLPDLYGIGAYPMNYPNEWDRKLGKTGYGIWLHGTETAFYSRPPLDSEGCVVMPNMDLQNVSRYLEPGETPIVVTEQVQWLERPQWRSLRREVHEAVERWRSDWASSDVERYLAHYADGFWSGKQDLQAWKARKRRIARWKSWQKVDLSGLSLFAYPEAASDGRQMVVANFSQHYDSNNFESRIDKRLYLVKEAGQWKVLYEGAQ
ncbi:MAG: L,D-transpeptidase Cds6 family protein [Pseudomonadota bacterium]